jgi:rhodanese-related sulfurtransferase
MLNALCQGPKPVEWLAEHTGQSIASASAHLKVLRSACLVTSQRQGKYVIYAIASEKVAGLCLMVREVAREQLPQVREVIRDYYDDPESMLKLQPRELLAGVKQGQWVLLDLRPADEYAHGHLPHARSLPAEDLEKRIRQLPKNQRIIAYCRGPYCVAAVEAVNRMRGRGLDAWRLPLGVAEWRAAGQKLERGERDLH